MVGNLRLQDEIAESPMNQQAADGAALDPAGLVASPASADDEPMSLDAAEAAAPVHEPDARSPVSLAHPAADALEAAASLHEHPAPDAPHASHDPNAPYPEPVSLPHPAADAPEAWGGEYVLAVIGYHRAPLPHSFEASAGV